MSQLADKYGIKVDIREAASRFDKLPEMGAGMHESVSITSIVKGVSQNGNDTMTITYLSDTGEADDRKEYRDTMSIFPSDASGAADWRTEATYNKLGHILAKVTETPEEAAVIVNSIFENLDKVASIMMPLLKDVKFRLRVVGSKDATKDNPLNLKIPFLEKFDGRSLYYDPNQHDTKVKKGDTSTPAAPDRRTPPMGGGSALPPRR